MSAEESEPFVEHDDGETRMTYDDGKWTWYVIAIWLCVLTGLIIYAAQLLVPSLSRWGAP